MSRLRLIRHGETKLNSSLRYRGRSDVALSDIGFRQAELLRERLKAEIIDFGRLGGLAFDEINQLYPEAARMWMERDPGLAYPNGESLAALDRCVQLFKSRLDVHNKEQTILIVAHSGVLRILLCQLLCLEPRQRWQIRLDLASLTVIETYPESAILTLLNDISHLTERS